MQFTSRGRFHTCNGKLLIIALKKMRIRTSLTLSQKIIRSVQICVQVISAMPTTSSFIIMVSRDDYNSKIHYYDVEKREHFILDTTEYGSNIVDCGDGVILSEASYDFSAYSAVYYVIPPLGLIFKLTDTQEIPVTQYESDNTGNDDDIRSHGFFQYELRKRVTDNTCSDKYPSSHARFRPIHQVHFPSYDRYTTRHRLKAF